eukprot:1141039-Pelagomonas_calceolata.AAC.2
MGSTPSPAPSFSGLTTPPTLMNNPANAGATPFPFGSTPAAPTPSVAPTPAQPLFGSAATPPAPDQAGGGAAGAGGAFTMGTGGEPSGRRRVLRAKRHG